MAGDQKVGERGTSNPTPEGSEVGVDWLSNSALIPDSVLSQSGSGEDRSNVDLGVELPQEGTLNAPEPSPPSLFTPLRPKPRADSFWTYGPKWIALITVVVGLGFWNAHQSNEEATSVAEAPLPRDQSETAEMFGETVEVARPNAQATTEATTAVTRATESTRFDGPTATINLRSVPTGANVAISDGEGSSYGRCQTPCVADVPFHEGVGASNRIVLDFQIDGYQTLRLERHLFGVEPVSFVALPTPAKADR